MKKIFTLFSALFLLMNFSAYATDLGGGGGGSTATWHSFDDYVSNGWVWDQFTIDAYKSTYNPIYSDFDYVEKGIDLTAEEGSNKIDTCSTQWVSKGSTSTYTVCNSNMAPNNRNIHLIGRQPLNTFTSGIVQGKWIED